ncbi:tripartite motif-containing protein 2-like [Argopecten irradians]|uniref:tripartite motif-containing protein 2-like n=1 Tax=Argopecten irradians TaxID=31199 RepID=UPI003711A0F3
MAEGGEVETQTTIAGDKTEKSIDIDPRLIQCPICLEQLRHPKSLPCLHTFCKECLNIYIIQEADTFATLFLCPVCRSETVPVDSKEKKENWAKQFPTNNFIIEVSKTNPPKYQQHECDPCKKRSVVNVAATVWWKEYNRFLCDNCLHKVQNAIDDDLTLIEVKSGQKFIPPIATTSIYNYCPKHKKEMDLFCEDHQSVCCSTCIAVTHRRCEEVTTLSEHGEKVRSSTQLQDMRSGLQNVAADMESLTEFIKTQTKHLDDGKDDVLKLMTDLRKRIDARLDKLQRDITDEVVTTYQEEKQKLDDMLHKCERMSKGIRTTQALSESDFMDTDDMQIVSVLQRGNMEIKSCKEIITQISKSLTNVEISLDCDDKFLVDEEALILGRVKVVRSLAEVPIKLPEKHLHSANVKEVAKLCIKTATDVNRCQATGMVYLPNGHIVLADFGNKKVKLFKENGELVDELTLKGKPWDLCLVDNNTVAVSMGTKRLISMINMTSSKLSMISGDDIDTGKQCDGITYKDGQFMVSTGYSSNRDIYSVMEGQEVNVLHTPSAKPYYLVYDPTTSDVIVSLHTNTEGDTVLYRLSSDGTTTEMAKVGLLKKGNGVDVDEEGNVYVCGRASNNVVQISCDGKIVRELVTSESVKEPFTISVSDHRFVLSSDASDSSNYITIHELY